jgi:hypothetical protein
LGSVCEAMTAIMTGSLGRLEGCKWSDADFLLLYCDDGPARSHWPDIDEQAHRAFQQLGNIFDAQTELKAPPHGSAYWLDRKPGAFDFRPARFPIYGGASILYETGLADTDPDVLIKRLSFLEGRCFFNLALFNELRRKILKIYSLDDDKSTEFNASNNTLWPALKGIHLSMLASALKPKTSNHELKYLFFRLPFITASLLTLIGCHADPEVYKNSGGLIQSLSRNTGAKLALFKRALQNRRFPNKKTWLSMVDKFYAAYLIGTTSLGEEGAPRDEPAEPEAMALLRRVAEPIEKLNPLPSCRREQKHRYASSVFGRRVSISPKGAQDGTSRLVQFEIPGDRGELLGEQV